MSQKYIDGFVPFSLPRKDHEGLGDIPFAGLRTLFRPEDALSPGPESPAEWLPLHFGTLSLVNAIQDLRDDDYVDERLAENPKAYGTEFVIMRTRIYEDGSMAVYGPAREGDREITSLEDVKSKVVSYPQDKGQGPRIGEGERPQAVFTVEEIYAAHVQQLPIASAKFENGRHVCEVDITVEDAKELKESLGLRKLDNSARLSRALQDIIFTPFREQDFGATLCDLTATCTGDEIKVRLEVDVTDARLFNHAIAVKGRQSGFDDDWVPSDAGEAIFEAWCGSNDSASPDSYGLSMDDWREVEIEEPEGFEP